MRATTRLLSLLILSGDLESSIGLAVIAEIKNNSRTTAVMVKTIFSPLVKRNCLMPSPLRLSFTFMANLLNDRCRVCRDGFFPNNRYGYLFAGVGSLAAGVAAA